MARWIAVRSGGSSHVVSTPSTSTVPSVGNSKVAATWSRVVFPAPFGPMTIQRSLSCAVQLIFRNSSDDSRRTDTPRSLSTSSDTALCPSSAPQRVAWARHE